MRRISGSFDRNGMRAGKILAGVVLALWASLLGLQPASSADAGEAVGNQKIDIDCARRDLELVTLIERNGNNGMNSTATLVETSGMMQTARAACGAGDIDNALALYDTALRRLENPSDYARR